VDRDAERVFKCRNWKRSADGTDAWRRRIEETKAAGDGMKRQQRKLDSKTKKKAIKKKKKKKKKKRKKNLGKGNRSHVQYKHTIIFTTSLAEIRPISINVPQHIPFASFYQNATHKTQ
jgi:hypothetical protein